MAANRLISDELLELRQLVKGSDSIELKLTLPENTYRSAAAALGVDPLEAQIRQVFFFDTPDLELNRAGVVAGPPGPGSRRRLRDQAAARRPACPPSSASCRSSWSRSTPSRAATCARPRSRASRRPRCAKRCRRQAAAQAVLQAAAGVLRRARAPGDLDDLAVLGRSSC